jgi:hypothetical protein
MNERIRELAEQAGYMEDSFGFGHWNMPECKKFVELIVQECIDNLYWHGHDKAASQLEWLRVNRFGIKQ